MKIKCPICNQTSTTRPEGLLGRIYVCDRCHHMLHVKILQQNHIQWQPLWALETCHRVDRDDENG